MLRETYKRDPYICKENPIYVQKETRVCGKRGQYTHGMKRALCIVERALHDITRTLCIMKRALHTIKRALCILKRALYIMQRDLCIMKWSPIYYEKTLVYYEKSPAHHEKSPAYSEKSSAYYEKSPVYYEKSPVFYEPCVKYLLPNRHSLVQTVYWKVQQLAVRKSISAAPCILPCENYKRDPEKRHIHVKRDLEKIHTYN